MCTRFLYAVLPSELYWGDQSLKYLNGFFADDLAKLYHYGVAVPHLNYPADPSVLNLFRTRAMSQVSGVQIHACIIGLKGDWPYLRKASMGELGNQ